MRGAWQNVQVAPSTDLVTWAALGDALPLLPIWARQQGGLVWARDVTALPGERGYVIYFTAHRGASDRQCIGVATSDVPGGPFTPYGDGSVVCDTNEGGSIDPATFVDEDGSRYLLWEYEGQRGLLGRQDGWIYIQAMSPDALASERWSAHRPDSSEQTAPGKVRSLKPPHSYCAPRQERSCNS